MKKRDTGAIDIRRFFHPKASITANGNELLNEETNNNDAMKKVQQQSQQAGEQTATRKSKKKKIKLDILSTDALAHQQLSIDIAQQNVEEIVEPIRKKAKTENRYG